MGGPHVSTEGRVIYFAHSMQVYGKERTKTVEEDIARQTGCKVLNPESLDWGKLVKDSGSFSNAYRDIVQSCTEVVALEHEGHIGRGVYEELSYAFQLGRRVRVYREGQLVGVKHIHLADTSDWRVRFGSIEACKDFSG